MSEHTAGLRERICAEALTWVGTPYHHHARVRGAGVDCINLLAAVFEAVGLAQVGQLPHYAQQWHLHQCAEVFAEGLDTHARRVPQPQPGDVVLFWFGQTHSHAGIWLPGNQFVHAYSRRNRAGVIVSDMTPEWAKRDPWYWTLLEDA